MQQRFILFIILTVVILVGNNLLMGWLFPPPERPQQQAAKKDEPEGEKKGAEKKDGKQQKDAGDDQPDKKADDEPPEVKPAKKKAPQRPAEWVVLGSLDPATGYRMAVTLNSRGAAVERIELSAPGYREQDEASGYLGYLAATAHDTDGEPAGCRVNAVPPGSPADRAGLKVGDVITSLGGEATATPYALRRELQQLSAGAEIELSIRRNSQTMTISATLVDSPMAVVRPEYDDPAEPETQHPLSFLLSLEAYEDRDDFDPAVFRGLDELTEEPWQVQSASQDEAVLSYTLDDAQLKIVKHFSLVKAPQEAVDDATYQAYHLKLDVRVENLDAENAANIAYRLQGPTGLPLEGWWYINKLHPSHFSAAGVRDVTWRQAGGGHYLYRGPVIVSDYENEETTSLFTSGEPVPLEYAGVDTQYFNCSIIAASEDKEQIPKFSRGFATVVGKVDDLNSRRTDVTFRLISRAEQIPAGGTLSHSFTIFAGPKKPELLAEYGLGDAVVYGWFFFVTKPLLWLLHLFYAIIPNYGIAIILLTVLVRACMTPISRKAAMNAAKMQELAPEMKQIAEKYKEDMEKRMRAQRELFAKHNYHPLSGCSLMFLQLPIFIGLYRGLSVDIELRQAPLIPGIPWASNLAAPDQLFRWDGLWETLPHLLQFGTENGMLGPYFNLLPCLTIALFMIQQKLFTPPPTDDQQAANQKVMKFMMIFIGLLFFRVPSGLCLYFIVSSMWGIAERKLLPPPTKGETPPPEKKKKEKKGEGTMDKLRAWAQSKVDAASQKSTQKSTQTSRNGESERERRKARRKQKRR